MCDRRQLSVVCGDRWREVFAGEAEVSGVEHAGEQR